MLLLLTRTCCWYAARPAHRRCSRAARPWRRSLCCAAQEARGACRRGAATRETSAREPAAEQTKRAGVRGSPTMAWRFDDDALARLGSPLLAAGLMSTPPPRGRGSRLVDEDADESLLFARLRAAASASGENAWGVGSGENAWGVGSGSRQPWTADDEYPPSSRDPLAELDDLLNRAKLEADELAEASTSPWRRNLRGTAERLERCEQALHEAAAEPDMFYGATAADATLSERVLRLDAEARVGLRPARPAPLPCPVLPPPAASADPCPPPPPPRAAAQAAARELAGGAAGGGASGQRHDAARRAAGARAPRPPRRRAAARRCAPHRHRRCDAAADAHHPCGTRAQRCRRSWRSAMRSWRAWRACWRTRRR